VDVNKQIACNCNTVNQRSIHLNRYLKSRYYMNLSAIYNMFLCYYNCSYMVLVNKSDRLSYYTQYTYYLLYCNPNAYNHS